MGRPRAVVYKNLPLYDKLHTEKVKMWSRVSITALYLIKETANFYVSTEVWASSASKFKVKKPATLSVDIPVVTDEKSINFLEQNCWGHWVEKDKDNSDIIESLEFLKRVAPDKEPVFFYELTSLINTYNHGTFISYDDEGNEKVFTEGQIKHQKYFNGKYSRVGAVPEIKAMYKRWTEEKDVELRDQYLKECIDFERDYAFKHNNLINTFIDVCKNAVCFPVAFSRGTADWHKEKYGKTCSYAHAGEIYFICTEDKIYFDINRHF